MRKKFFSNLLFLLAVNLLVKPFWLLGIDREVQNQTGWEEYGMYFAVYNFSLWFYMLLDVGITYFNNRNIAQYEQLLPKYLSNILILKLLLAVVYLLLTGTVAILLGFGREQLYLLAFLGANQVLISLIFYFRSNINALHLFKTDSLLSITDRLLMILFCSLLLWSNIIEGDITIRWFIYAQTTAYGITALICLIVVLQHAALQFKWNYPFLLHILKKSYPFAIAVILMAFYTHIDAVMIERMLGENGKTEAGIYAAGYRLLDAVAMVALLFSSLLLPIFSRMLKEKEPVSELLQFSYKLIFAIAAVLAINCYFFREEIMALLYDNIAPHSGDVFGILILSFIGIVTLYIHSTLLTAGDRMRSLNLTALGGVIGNIILNYWLIPEHGAFGAAIATLITQGAVALTFFVLVRVYFKVGGDLRLIGALLALPVGIIVIGWLLGNIFENWYNNLALCTLLSIVFALVLGMINVREIARWYREKEVS